MILGFVRLGANITFRVYIAKIVFGTFITLLGIWRKKLKLQKSILNPFQVPITSYVVLFHRFVQTILKHYFLIVNVGGTG